ncbi:MAG: hypothetical protein ACRBCT_02285 [Alphaproteobacteria bacterium]
MLNLLTPETDLINGLQSHTRNRPLVLRSQLNQDDRWLAASSMQKAIRRGHIREATYAANVLKAFNTAHLWNRLRVIALEDIGIANINLVAQVLWVAGKEQWRIKHGGEDLILSYIIHHLCQSKKSRTLDDALYVAEYHPLYKQQRLTYSGMSEEELMDGFHDKGLDVIEHILICRYICGRRYRSEVLTLPKGNPVKIMELAHSVNAPLYVLDLLGLSKSQEYFTCLLPCLMQLEQSNSLARIEDTSDEEPQRINRYLEASLDRHTRHGKQAFRQFLEVHPEILEYIRKHTDKANPVNLVGWAVFILEGQSLNNRIVYDGSECLRELAAQAWLHSGGMAIDAQPEFLALVQDHWKGLRHARRSVTRR